jgi:hypothetical protein
MATAWSFAIRFAALLFILSAGDRLSGSFIAAAMASSTKAESGGTETSAADASMSCAQSAFKPPSVPSAKDELRAADFAKLLHGTWVRRLFIEGVLIQSNSFFYFNMTDPEKGSGEALMIDKISQGWDSFATQRGALQVHDSKAPNETAPRHDARNPSSKNDGELEAATTGAFWSVLINKIASGAEGPSRGSAELQLSLNGEYRGTGKEYPRNGFRFVESGKFYLRDRTYVTASPWRSPPMLLDASEPNSDSIAYTPVDRVEISPGQQILKSKHRRSDFEYSSKTTIEKMPTITYIICKDKIVDTYIKVSDKFVGLKNKNLKQKWLDIVNSGSFNHIE